MFAMSAGTVLHAPGSVARYFRKPFPNAAKFREIRNPHDAAFITILLQCPQRPFQQNACHGITSGKKNEDVCEPKASHYISLDFQQSPTLVFFGDGKESGACVFCEIP